MVAPKREKMTCQRSMAQKKREREREKEEIGMIQERKAIISRSKRYPSIHPSIHPSTHTPAPFDRDCMTCFSMDPLFGFTIYRIQVCTVLSYLELHKGM